jgi:phage terminase small subunit
MSTPTATAKAALQNLPPKQRQFVQVYCESFNATKAALAAGYAKKSARMQGSRLLTNDNIKSAVKAVLALASMEPEEIAARWTALARAGLSDFYTVEEYEVATEVQQSLTSAITEIEEKITYEYDYMVRSWEVLGTKPDDQAKELEQHDSWVRHRKLDILRHQMQLERNPAAVRIIAGPKEKKQRVVLDLVKAESLGMLDLIKAIVPTEYGTKVELRSPDEALTKLATWQGMLVKKVDLTTKGEALPAPPVLGAMTLEQKKELLAAMRQTQQPAPDAQ